MLISRSGYYAWRKCKKSLRQREIERLIPKENKKSYLRCQISKALFPMV
jgi:hypothetical protein